MGQSIQVEAFVLPRSLLTQLTRELRLTLTLLPGSHQYVTKVGQ